MSDDTGKPVTHAFLARLKELVAQNRRTEAVKQFMKQVGTPGFMVAIMPLHANVVQIESRSTHSAVRYQYDSRLWSRQTITNYVRILHQRPYIGNG